MDRTPETLEYQPEEVLVWSVCLLSSCSVYVVHTSAFPSPVATSTFVNQMKTVQNVAAVENHLMKDYNKKLQMS